MSFTENMKALQLLKRLNGNIPYSQGDEDNLLEAIAELEELQNRSCENCKHCDAVYENIIHCQYFEELLSKEIGKCDKYTKKDK